VRGRTHEREQREARGDNPAHFHLIGVELHSKNEKRAMVKKLTCAVATRYCFSARPTEGEE
jgi:hypothetical protein